MFLPSCDVIHFHWKSLYTTSGIYRRNKATPLRFSKEMFSEVPMAFTRREACSLIPALVAAGTGITAFAAQDDSLPSATFAFESIPVQNSDHAQIRKIIRGKLATGEHIEAHETTLPPNGYPHPPHHHVHSEMWLIREGTVELTISGTSHRLGAGGVGFVHSNEEHGIKNVGTGPATYYVVAIGPGADT
jgi:quercetin dioxygenase-like cupin family protein